MELQIRNFPSFPLDHNSRKGGRFSSISASIVRIFAVFLSVHSRSQLKRCLKIANLNFCARNSIDSSCEAQQRNKIDLIQKARGARQRFEHNVAEDACARCGPAQLCSPLRKGHPSQCARSPLGVHCLFLLLQQQRFGHRYFAAIIILANSILQKSVKLFVSRTVWGVILHFLRGQFALTTDRREYFIGGRAHSLGGKIPPL